MTQYDWFMIIFSTVMLLVTLFLPIMTSTF